MVDPVVVPEIRNFLRPFIRPDAYAAVREGYRYPVCSLYLDSDELALYQQVINGEKRRYKIRVRSYSENPSDRVFLEVKEKSNNIVHKRRAGVSRDQAVSLLADGDLRWLTDIPEDRRTDAEYFLDRTRLIRARPVIKIRYIREAYQSTGNEPARVTIDTDLRHAVTLSEDFDTSTGRWNTTPLNGTILEVKFTERYPAWIQDFVRVFGLKQQGVPKYILSIDHLFEGGRASALGLAGLILPPRIG